jgi:hypothetical protein
MITIDDYVKSCERENGGVERVVVAELCKIDQDNTTLTGREITAIAMTTGNQAYTWTPDMESAVFTDNGTGDRTNNSVFRTHTGTVIFKEDSDIVADMDEDLGRSTGLVFFVKYATPAGGTTKWKCFGFANGLTVTTSEASTGQNYEDLRGHTMNFEGKELTRALNIDQADVLALLVPVS